MLCEGLLEEPLDLEGQTVLEKTGDLLTVVTMAVADGEEMAVTQIEHVWIGEVGILVDFVGVVGRDAALGSEREFGDHVVDGVGIAGHFSLACCSCSTCGCLRLAWSRSFLFIIGDRCCFDEGPGAGPGRRLLRFCTLARGRRLARFTDHWERPGDN